MHKTHRRTSWYPGLNSYHASGVDVNQPIDEFDVSLGLALREEFRPETREHGFTLFPTQRGIAEQAIRDLDVVGFAGSDEFAHSYKFSTGVVLRIRRETKNDDGLSRAHSLDY